MNKTLCIEIHQDPTKHVEQFLQNWLQFGAYEQVSEVDYDLIGRTGKASRMSLTQFKITISGDIPSETFMLIDQLAKSCESDKIIEGEFIDKSQRQNPQFNDTFNSAFKGSSNTSFEIPFGMRQFGKISALSKTKMVLVLLLAIPLLIIMIPIAIAVMIVKIIMFKLNFK